MSAESERARPGLRIWHETEADEKLQGLCAEVRKLDVERARCLATIARAKHYRFLGCASLSEYGRNLGLRPCVTWDLARSGMLLERRPELEESLLSGELSFQAAAALFEVVTLEGEDAEEWVAKGRKEPTAGFVARVEERLEERKLGSPPIRLSVLLSREGRWKLNRCRDLIEQDRKRSLTEGEVLEVLAELYLERADRREGGKGRRAPKPRSTSSRHIPSWVKRFVSKRDGGRCAVPGCGSRKGLHYAHIEAFRHGGPATPENILQLCPLHNQMMEAGLLRITGTAFDPVFLAADGSPYRFQPPPGRPP